MGENFYVSMARTALSDNPPEFYLDNLSCLPQDLIVNKCNYASPSGLEWDPKTPDVIYGNSASQLKDLGNENLWCYQINVRFDSSEENIVFDENGTPLIGEGSEYIYGELKPVVDPDNYTKLLERSVIFACERGPEITKDSEFSLILIGEMRGDIM